MTTPQEIVRQLAAAARTASHALAASSTASRNNALERLADRIEEDDRNAVVDARKEVLQNGTALRARRTRETHLDDLFVVEHPVARHRFDERRPVGLRAELEHDALGVSRDEGRGADLVSGLEHEKLVVSRHEPVGIKPLGAGCALQIGFDVFLVDRHRR